MPLCFLWASASIIHQHFLFLLQLEGGLISNAMDWRRTWYVEEVDIQKRPLNKELKIGELSHKRELTGNTTSTVYTTSHPIASMQS